MAIHFTCLKCSANLEVEDALAGKDVACPRCSAVCSVPNPNKPRLKTPVQPQSYEPISPSQKQCPTCKTGVDPHALICVACGYNFVTGKLVVDKRKRRKGASANGGGGIMRLALRVVLLALLVGGGFGGVFCFLSYQAKAEIRNGLHTGEPDHVEEGYQKLDSYYKWLERLGFPNDYAFRYAQFKARRGKTNEKTTNRNCPIVVDMTVWGRGMWVNRTAWVKFRMVNFTDRPLPMHQRYFLLLGESGNVGLAESLVKPEEGIALQPGEGVRGCLCFDGMVKKPEFLEYNNGEFIVRVPVHVERSMDEYARNRLNHPEEGATAKEFPMWEPWAKTKLTAEEVKKLAPAQAVKPAASKGSAPTPVPTASR